MKQIKSFALLFITLFVINASFGQGKMATEKTVAVGGAAKQVARTRAEVI